MLDDKVERRTKEFVRPKVWDIDIELDKFLDVVRGSFNSIHRPADYGFNVGDMLWLREYVPYKDTFQHTGRHVAAIVCKIRPLESCDEKTKLVDFTITKPQLAAFVERELFYDSLNEITEDIRDASTRD